MKNVRLTIIGEGRMQRSVQRQIRKITKREDGAPRITLIARKPDLATFYDALDILVLPSREHDPFGMTVAEAMMRGVAVVVTDACGIAEYLKSGRTAMIAQPNDARALEEAIRRLSDGPTRTRIARAGQRTALKLFALDTMIDAYEEVMQK
jgi:glycosyltransferase involved in cell wall biosynthesis